MARRGESLEQRLYFERVESAITTDNVNMIVDLRERSGESAGA